MGMQVVAENRDTTKLPEAEEVLHAAGAADVMTASTDVSDRAQVEALEKEVTAHFGGADILLNNAGVGGQTSSLPALDVWGKKLGVTLWGLSTARKFSPRA